MKRFSASLFAGIAVAVIATAAVACTPMGVGKNATVDGSVMVAHTCDAWYDNRVRVIPGGDHNADEKIEIKVFLALDTKPGKTLVSKGFIPQAEHTYTYFHTGYPFMNEHQVVMGEHTWTGRQEIESSNGMLDISNLEALGLQRAKNAREIIQVMGDLAEKYGYCDGGEGLIIGDGKELWYFEVCGAGLLWTPESGKPGAMWAARRIPDDEFIICANRSRMGVIDFTDTKHENFMWSNGITDLPLEMGWWKEGEPFNFSAMFDIENYGEAAKSMFYCSRREWRGMMLVNPDLNLTAGSGRQVYPLSVKPAHKLSVSDLQKIYRDHYEGTPYDLTKGLAAGPFNSPIRYGTMHPKHSMESRKACMFERPICVPFCSYSFIAQTRADLPAAIGGCMWFGVASPDFTVYTPIYAGATRLPANWSDNVRTDYNRKVPYWAFNFTRVMTQDKWNVLFPMVQAKQAKIEKRYFDRQAAFEEAALEAYKADPIQGIQMVTDYTCDNMRTLLPEWWAFNDELVAKSVYSNMIYDAEGDKFIRVNPYSSEFLEGVDFGRIQAEETAKGL